MEQQDWHKWRSEGIGSSDAPIIMGTSPYTTMYELWEIKTGRKEKSGGNWATRKGHALEPIARAHIEFLTGLEFSPVLCQHPTFPWLRASLDGYNKETNTILEIKCPGREDHAKAREGIVPEKYIAQLQHQLFVTGAHKVLYFSFTEENNATVFVYQDEKYLLDYFIRASDFWACVKNNQAPNLTDRDFKLKRSKLLREKLDDYRGLLPIDSVRAEYLKQTIWQEFEIGQRRWRCSNYLLDGPNYSIFIQPEQQILQ
jgi:putative phage-type endonuclease